MKDFLLGLETALLLTLFAVWAQRRFLPTNIEPLGSEPMARKKA